jgi:aspartate aminotransferase-like enzyme
MSVNPATNVNPTLFTVGPVTMYPETLRLGSLQLPYFRTPEFSEVVLCCESMMLELVDAPGDSRCVLLTASGTGAMEAAVINLLGPEDRALIISGGSFGERFCEICRENEIPFDSIRLEPGASLHPDQISRLQLDKYKALLVNAHETSTGVLYDLAQLGQACRDAGILFVVDAISAFLCDPISMNQMGIDLLLTSSQKALALPPGLSLIILSPRALHTARTIKVKSYYFAFQRYLCDGSRGQTPFTPAVGIVLQLHQRLKAIETIGAPAIIQRTAALASHFRKLIRELPFRIFAESPSNALTALSPTNGSSAYDVYSGLAARFNLVVTPNGGQLRDRIFRVGHMGNLTAADMETVAHALTEISQ